MSGVSLAWILAVINSKSWELKDNMLIHDDSTRIQAFISSVLSQSPVTLNQMLMLFYLHLNMRNLKCTCLIKHRSLIKFPLF